MAKKKKAGGKGKKKVVKDSKAASTKKPKGPTEKEIFEDLVNNLKQELEVAVVRLEKKKTELSSIRELVGKEMNSKELCVSHLRKMLKREFEQNLEIQDRLQTERDLIELIERRAQGKFAVSERSGEAARSYFLQQKMELEGKLSLLEELRLERNSQKAHLKKAETAVEERASTMRAEIREDDWQQIDRLLQNREDFKRLCASTRQEWKSAFDLRLSVHAEKQLAENVRLRSEYKDATEALLSEQERCRQLKARQKAVDLQEEIQISVDEYAAKRRAQQMDKIQRLAQARRKTSLEVASLQKEFVESGKKLNTPTDPKESFAEEIESKWNESIRDVEEKRCGVEDKCYELAVILKNQACFKKSMEVEVQKCTNENGVMLSVILRAGKIFETRCSKVEIRLDTDYDILMQIRQLLNLVEC